MTHDPRLPTLATLEEVMHHNPFELVDTPWGHIEAWRASTLATGTMGALAQVYDTVRNDAATTAERVAALDATKEKMQTLCEMIDNLHRRMDQHAARMEAFEVKRRADEEEQEAAAREFEEPIELPPDTGDLDEPDIPDVPTALEDADTHQHQPGGELHEIAAKDEEPASTLPEPPPETEPDAGGVPLSYGNIPTSYAPAQNQASL